MTKKSPDKSLAAGPIEQPESRSIPYCGLVMPISSIDGCTEAHWADVREIISEAAREAGFHPRLVSSSNEVGVIQSRIVRNLYTDDIVLCDVSGKNANVMFELGMRLAFDKPTVIIKDDKTNYSFDTGVIEHLEYPRDLRYNIIGQFKIKLADALQATFAKADHPDAQTFLKSFKVTTVAKLEEKEVSAQEYLLDQLRSVLADMKGMARDKVFDYHLSPIESNVVGHYEKIIYSDTRSNIDILVEEIKGWRGVLDCSYKSMIPHEYWLLIKFSNSANSKSMIARVDAIVRRFDLDGNDIVLNTQGDPDK